MTTAPLSRLAGKALAAQLVLKPARKDHGKGDDAEHAKPEVKDDANEVHDDVGDGERHQLVNSLPDLFF